MSIEVTRKLFGILKLFDPEQDSREDLPSTAKLASCTLLNGETQGVAIGA
ncbi:MAG: hypothetical protein ACLPLR_06615 [Terriglobales bacterium]